MRAIARMALVPMVALALAPLAAAQPKYQYVVDTTNKIFDLEYRSMDPTPAEVAEISARACQTLKRLLADPAFHADLDKAAGRARDSHKLRQDLQKNLTLFMDSFIQPEGELLKSAGVSSIAAQRILWAAAAVRDSLSDDSLVDPKIILDRIDRLTREVCSSAQQLSDSKKRRELIVRWGIGVGGVLLIVVDAVATVPTGGVFAASIALGAAGAGAAIATATQ